MTATESNMPNSSKLLNYVQEVFREVSEPNPMGKQLRMVNIEFTLTLEKN